MHDAIAMSYEQKCTEACCFEEDSWHKHSKCYPKWALTCNKARVPETKQKTHHPKIFLLRKKTKKKSLNGGTNKVTRRNHYLSIVRTHHSLIEKEVAKRKINAKIKEKHELKWSTYQNTKERPSTSTFRTGTDVNIHCKLLHCPHHPKNCPNSLPKSEPST